MHQRTQRMVGRWLFAILCLVPTVAVTAWALTVNRPGHTYAWESRLSNRFGLEFTIDRVSHPVPGSTVLQSVRVSDPETHERITVIRLIEIVQDDATTAVIFSQPRVADGQLTRLWQVLHDQLTRAGSLPPGELHLIASELTCDLGDSATTLTGVHGRIEPGAGRPVATVEFRIAGQEMVQPAKARLVREKQSGEPFTLVEFHTGGNELPCSLLSAYVTWLKQVGPECRFNGTWSAAPRRAGWEGEVTGRLTRVDLDRLVGNVFPHKLSGQASVTLRNLRFRGDRLQTAEGAFSAGPGVLSRSLIHAVADAGVAQETEAGGDLSDDLIPFDQVAFTFNLQQEGMSLLGACDNNTPGTVLTQDNTALLVQPIKQPLPAVALVRALVPDSRVQVPATRETNLLLRVLPLPGLEPLAGARKPNPHLRFGGGVE